MSRGPLPLADHPVLIPTSEGPVGGIVSAPRGDPKAAAILLPGGGRPARSGTNSFWTDVARSMAAMGVAVLRYDYSREGETLPIGEGVSGLARKLELDLRLLRQIQPWFVERAGDVPLLLIGSCGGARGALELSGREPDAYAGVFLVVPMLMGPVNKAEEAAPARRDREAVDPAAVELVRATLDRIPVWIVTGERDLADVPRLRQLLGPAGAALEVDQVPGLAVHFLDHPHVQEPVRRRLLARVAAALQRADNTGYAGALSGPALRPPAGGTS